MTINHKYDGHVFNVHDVPEDFSKYRVRMVRWSRELDVISCLLYQTDHIFVLNGVTINFVKKLLRSFASHVAPFV